MRIQGNEITKEQRAPTRKCDEEILLARRLRAKWLTESVELCG